MSGVNWQSGGVASPEPEAMTSGRTRRVADCVELALCGSLVFGDERLDAAALRHRVNERKVHLTLLPRGGLIHFPEHPSTGFVADLLACHETGRCYLPHGLNLRARNAPLSGYVIPRLDRGGQRQLVLGSWQALEDDIDAYARLFQGERGLRFSALMRTSGDIFLREIYTPLLAGHQLHVPEHRATLADPAKLRQWITTHGIQVLHLTPAWARVLFDGHSRLPSVRFVMLAGEPLYWRDVPPIQAAIAENGQVFNLYGPVETTLTRLHFLADPGRAGAPEEPVPVGRPTGQGRAIVVREGQPCGVRETGEILIRHPYPAHGYLRSAEGKLTLESPFVVNPFQADDPVPVYRTGEAGFIDEQGDLVRLGAAVV